MLYIDPAHREAEAISLLEEILEMDPSNGRAQLWLAYCCIHYLMDEPALRRAIALTEKLEEDSELGGAAAMLRAEAWRTAMTFRSPRNSGCSKRRFVEIQIGSAIASDSLGYTMTRVDSTTHWSRFASPFRTSRGSNFERLRGNVALSRTSSQNALEPSFRRN